jgi:sulfatase modifying factor 1
VSASADSAELAVLEGRVDFLDAEQMATPVETAKKAGTRKGVTAKLESMSTREQAEVKQAVEQSKDASASIDLNRLADTVDGYAPKPNYVVKSALDMELIWCPPGSFIMGGLGADSPAHPVILTKGFYLGKFEVTQEQYRAVSKTNPSHWRGPNLPVEHVSWNDAIEFLKIINQKEQKPNKWAFSLPTEAEWEYACRAGTITINSWGNSPNPDFAAKFANLKMNGINKTVLIGSYRPNQWGFYDMHGNVHEWCFDYFGEYTTNLILDPKGPIKGKKRILRGGGYDSLYGQSGIRLTQTPNHRSGNLGFRVALKQVD